MAQAEFGKCPICGKPAVEKTKPFCSPRCATLDLGRWLGEGYRIPATENPEESTSLPNQNEDEEIG
ncbi:MAG: DNA gyrase inhibitor YacG [Alphaproteobacteria bacterium]